MKDLCASADLIAKHLYRYNNDTSDICEICSHAFLQNPFFHVAKAKLS